MPAPAVATVKVARFKLRASNGFVGWVEVRQRKATLLVGRRVGPRETYAGKWAAYHSRGSIARFHVRTRFGGRGRINVRFRPRSVVRRTPPPHCKGKPNILRNGVFVGTIRFHGERGFTALDTARAPGKLRTFSGWKCDRNRPLSDKGGAALVPMGRAGASVSDGPVVLKARNGRTWFEVAADRYPREEGVTRFLAGRIERRPRMRIERGAYAFGEDRTFVFDRRLTWATVEPPRPFVGSARFARGEGGPWWTGPLGVELPGIGIVPLTGEGYTARLYRGRPEESPGY